MFQSIAGTHVRSNRPGSTVVHVATGEAFPTRYTPYAVHTLCGRDVSNSKRRDRDDYPRYGPELVAEPITCQRCLKLKEAR